MKQSEFEHYLNKAEDGILTAGMALTRAIKYMPPGCTIPKNLDRIASQKIMNLVDFIEDVRKYGDQTD